MPRTTQTSDNIGDSGGFLEKAGTYHLVIEKTLADMTPQGEPYSGLIAKCTVAAGTDGTQKGRHVTLWLRDGQPTDGDGGKFSTQIQTAFLLASDLITASQLGKAVDYEPADSEGRQIIAAFATKKGKDDQQRLQLDGAKVYHVDDPRVHAVPKDAASLALIPAKLRHPKEYFDAAQAASGGGGSAKPESVSGVPGSDISDLF